MNLSIRITVPAPETFRVQVVRHKEVRRKGPEFELNMDPARSIAVEEQEDFLRVADGCMSLTIDRRNGSMFRFICLTGGMGYLSIIRNGWGLR